VPDCSGGAELQIAQVIRPDGELDNTFLCSVTGFDLLWSVNGESFSFLGSDNVGAVRNSTSQPDTFSQLLVIVHNSSTVSTRISMLRFVPQPNVNGQISVTCQAQGFEICTATPFVGK
jgi:hypothetical protein